MKMYLVVDANVLFSALIAPSGKTADLLFLEEIELFAPEFLLDEFARHKKEIIEKSGYSETEFGVIVSLFKERVKFAPLSVFSSKIPDAKRICPDQNDIEYFALAHEHGNWDLVK